MKRVIKRILAAIGRVTPIRKGWLNLMRWLLQTFALPLSWRDIIIWPLATYILGEGYTQIVKLGTGPTLAATLDNSIGRLVIFYGQLKRHFYEPRTLQLALHLLPAQGKAIVAGAHVGYHALHFAQATKDQGGLIYAFEPVSNYYAQLERNRKLSGLNNL